jgi:hypothetical protein
MTRARLSNRTWTKSAKPLGSVCRFRVFASHSQGVLQVFFMRLGCQATCALCPSRVALVRQGWTPAAALALVPASLNQGGWAEPAGTCPQEAQPRPAPPSPPEPLGLTGQSARRCTPCGGVHQSVSHGKRHRKCCCALLGQRLAHSGSGDSCGSGGGALRHAFGWATLKTPLRGVFFTLPPS